MNDNAAVSIIICTCNRANHLRQTLDAFQMVCVPQDLPCELIVVDNGSTDDTASVVQSCQLPNMAVRYISEPRRGQCYARNTGLAAAQGQVILFTDDDVRPPADWVEEMCRPIVSGHADAVAGGIILAPDLVHDWMSLMHRHWLASTDGLTGEALTTMIGANMAFTKAALARIPSFDTELGPGALGFMDDTLFSYQLREAGYRIVPRMETKVVHHFDPSRLTRENWLAQTRPRGRSSGYMAYHWHHWNYPWPHLRLLLNLVRLGAMLLTRPAQADTLSKEEMAQRVTVWMLRQYLLERKRPRNYAKRGLVKRNQEK